MRLTAGNVQDSTFISKGFSNGKDASRCFSNHEKTTPHRTAVELMITLPRTTGDVAKMLSSTLAAEKRDNQCYLLKVAESIKFLARQSIPLLGDGDEEDSNYMQLLHLHVADDLQLLSCMHQKKGQVHQSSGSK